MSHTFKMAKLSGSFLADGNVGNKFHFCEVEPRLEKGESLVFDFTGVTNMTDSFSRACFETLATEHPDEVLANIRFKDCSETIKGFISDAISSGLAAARREPA
jgi:hypothetical protein